MVGWFGGWPHQSYTHPKCVEVRWEIRRVYFFPTSILIAMVGPWKLAQRFLVRCCISGIGSRLTSVVAQALMAAFGNYLNAIQMQTSQAECIR